MKVLQPKGQPGRFLVGAPILRHVLTTICSMVMMQRDVRVVTIFYETSSLGHMEACRRVPDRQEFCRAICRCTPLMTQLVKLVLAVGWRDDRGLLPGCVEHEGDFCAEPAACPTLLPQNTNTDTETRSRSRFPARSWAPKTAHSGLVPRTSQSRASTGVPPLQRTVPSNVGGSCSVDPALAILLLRFIVAEQLWASPAGLPSASFVLCPTQASRPLQRSRC